MDKPNKIKHRAGFVSILGKPNAGKSTLLNRLMGSKMSIVTPKAQTTRHRILAIYNDPDHQIIFSDTPGIIEQPQYGLQEKMMEGMKDVYKDSDAFLYVVNLEKGKAMDDAIAQKLNGSQKPILVVLNKMDTSNPKHLEQITEYYHSLLPHAEILPISASIGTHTEFILPKLQSWMPEFPPYYDKESFTDRSERFFVNEIIREKILENYQKEIPYSVEIVTDAFKRKNNGIEIEVTIYTERESQKAILLGHKGIRLSHIKKKATYDISEFIGEKIHLNLFIKVAKNWRNDNRLLSQFGY